MANVDLTPTGFDSNTGWIGTATNMASSNDTRVTDGVVSDTFDAALTNPGDTFGVAANCTINVEARTQGTINRTKQLVLDLKYANGTIINTFTTTDIAGTDTVYSSTTLTGINGVDRATANGLFLTATVTEGGGMPDSATVEIDHLYVNVNFDPPPLSITETNLVDGDTFPDEETIETTLDFTEENFINNNTFNDEVIDAVYELTETNLVDADAFPTEETFELVYDLAEETFTNTNTFGDEVIVLAETTRVIMIT